MDQVYLQEQPVEHHHSHHHSQHPHELVDPTLASVHLDPSSGEQAHDVYLDHGADVEEGHLVHNEVQQEGDGGEHDPSAYDAQALVEAHQLEQQLELDHHTGHHHHHGHHAHHLDPDSLVHGTLEDAGVGYHHMGEEEAGMDMDKPRVSHNRNPGGKNQYGSPVDPDKLREILKHYFNVECITEWKTVLTKLEAEHGIKIKRATLGRYLRQFNIGGSRRMNYSKEMATPIVIDHIRENDPHCKESPTKIMRDLGKRGIHIKRDVIRLIMQEHFPLGFDQRRRNSKFKKRKDDSGSPTLRTLVDGMEDIDPSADPHHHHHAHHQSLLLSGGIPTASSSGSSLGNRKLEEAQAEAARAIIMNMAMQAQMAVSYRQEAQAAQQAQVAQQQAHQQAQQRHLMMQQQQQQQHHRRLQGRRLGDDRDDNGVDESSHAESSAVAAAAAAAGLMQHLTDQAGAGTDVDVGGEDDAYKEDPSMDALREEALRQVAQLESFRNVEYDGYSEVVGEGDGHETSGYGQEDDTGVGVDDGMFRHDGGEQELDPELGVHEDM